MAGERPQETGHGHGNNHITLEKGEGAQSGGQDKAGKRQPELTAGLN
jgi:hypothetical protein